MDPHTRLPGLKGEGRSIKTGIILRELLHHSGLGAETVDQIRI